MTKLFINDTQPGLAPIELLRILIDEEQLPWDEAWRLVFDASKFVLNSTQKAAQERWPVHLLQKVLPRHLELIYMVNYFHIEDLKHKKHVEDPKIQEMSIVDETYPKSIKFSFLNFVCAHRTFGVSPQHAETLKRN